MFDVLNLVIFNGEIVHIGGVETEQKAIETMKLAIELLEEEKIEVEEEQEG